MIEITPFKAHDGVKLSELGINDGSPLVDQLGEREWFHVERLCAAWTLRTDGKPVAVFGLLPKDFRICEIWLACTTIERPCKSFNSELMRGARFAVDEIPRAAASYGFRLVQAAVNVDRKSGHVFARILGMKKVTMIRGRGTGGVDQVLYQRWL